MPKRLEVALRRTRIAKLLGVHIADNDVKITLESLGMRVLADENGWLVTPPPHRFDINIEADLIEELARIVGFAAINEADAVTRQKVRAMPEEEPTEQQALEILATRGYQEAITYAFVDPALQNKLFPGVETPELANPISAKWPSCARRCGRASSRPHPKTCAVSRTASGCSSTARVSSRCERRRRNRSDRRNRDRRAPAGAVGRKVPPWISTT